MNPSTLLFNNQVHVGRADIELPSNSILACASGNQSANHQDIDCAQFCLPLLLASARSTLQRSVTMVIGWTALKQVFGIAAKRPVAHVADLQNGPMTVSQEERQPMSVVVAFRSALKGTKTAIVSRGSFGPFPASTLRAVTGRLINVTPEAGGLLFIKNGRVSIDNSHDLNLTDRLGFWLGSLRCFRTFASRLYFTTERTA